MIPPDKPTTCPFCGETEWIDQDLPGDNYIPFYCHKCDHHFEIPTL